MYTYICIYVYMEEWLWTGVPENAACVSPNNTTKHANKYIYIHIHICINIHIYIYLYIYVYKCIHVYMHIWNIRTSIYIYIYIYTYMYICTYITFIHEVTKHFRFRGNPREEKVWEDRNVCDYQVAHPISYLEIGRYIQKYVYINVYVYTEIRVYEYIRIYSNTRISSISRSALWETWVRHEWYLRN